MIIGREKEIATLRGLLTSDESQFVAVYGRRRVGKTFLIREAYNYEFTFQHTGTYGATRKLVRGIPPFMGFSERNARQ